jgi:hypothetical protein
MLTILLDLHINGRPEHVIQLKFQAVMSKQSMTRDQGVRPQLSVTPTLP